MKWEQWLEWRDWKQRRLIAVIGFILAYIITIPIRGYEFLEGIFDLSQGVPLEAHLAIIVVGSIVVVILHQILEIIVKKFIVKK